ncbi:MAG: hypothetical protein MI747_08090 [Desulfobacterales bacterium]|nr:hypothetical protein [Desulfobacterales bacterium]
MTQSNETTENKRGKYTCFIAALAAVLVIGMAGLAFAGSGNWGHGGGHGGGNGGGYGHHRGCW